MDPSPDLGRIERLLALAWESGAPPLVVLTKADLARRPGGGGRPRSARSRPASPVLRGQRASRRRARPAAPAASRRAARSACSARPARASRPGQRAGRGDGDGHAGDPPRRRQGPAHHDVPGAGPDPRRRRGARHAGHAGGRPARRGGRAWTGRSPTSPRWPRACRFADCAHDGEPGCAVRGRAGGRDLPPRRWRAGASCSGRLAYELRRRDARLAAERARPVAADRPASSAAAATGRLTRVVAERCGSATRSRGWLSPGTGAARIVRPRG